MPFLFNFETSRVLHKHKAGASKFYLATLKSLLHYFGVTLEVILFHLTVAQSSAVKECRLAIQWG